MIYENMIQYGRHNISNSDIDAVIEVLKSDSLTQGPKVPEFEKKVAAYCGATFGVAVNSATSALHIGCMALDLKQGDILWTSPITFAASANCGKMCGASVHFVDIDPQTYNMSASNLEAQLKNAKKTGTLPKIVIPVHLSGQSCDMREISRLSKIYKFKIIEDASHAFGAKYDGNLIGDCRYSDITIFSFHPVKMITSGEGGMAMSNNRELVEKMRLFCNHGISKNVSETKISSIGPWYYEQLCLGYNYRMTDIQAALGISQLKKINKFVLERKKIAMFYNENFTGLPLKIPFQDKLNLSSWHLYIIRLSGVQCSKRHSEIFKFLRHKGIGVGLHYIPIYRHKFYHTLNFNYESFPETENYYKQAISLPIYPNLSKEDAKFVVETVKEILK